jgi:hypothetical protein
MPNQLAWFAIGALFGLLLCGWPWHPRFSRYGRRMSPPKGCHGPRLDLGSVQRGNGDGAPSATKPSIIPKPQFPQTRIIREDFLP